MDCPYCNQEMLYSNGIYFCPDCKVETNDKKHCDYKLGD